MQIMVKIDFCFSTYCLPFFVVCVRAARVCVSVCVSVCLFVQVCVWVRNLVFVPFHFILSPCCCYRCCCCLAVVVFVVFVIVVVVVCLFVVVVFVVIIVVVVHNTGSFFVCLLKTTQKSQYKQCENQIWDTKGSQVLRCTGRQAPDPRLIPRESPSGNTLVHSLTTSV